MKKNPPKICEHEVFENIFKTYAKDLKLFILTKSQDVQETEDILQETFVKLWNQCATVNYDTVKGYLYTTAKNLFLNLRKHDKVKLAHRKQVGTKHSVETPEFLIIEKEFMEKINRAIASLTPNEREVFLLNRIEKKKYREIAESLGISVKAVEKRMHQALIKMRKQIGNV